MPAAASSAIPIGIFDHVVARHFSDSLGVACGMVFEGRVVFEFLATVLSGPLLVSAPHGDGHTVILIPGFMQAPSNLLPIQGYLGTLGYDTHVFSPSTNGATSDIQHRLAEEVRVLCKARSAPVSLIGWSLGGLLARAVAAGRPACVRQVITLASPFAGDPADNSFLRMSAWTGVLPRMEVDEQIRSVAREPLSVPSSAIFSRTDGVLPWRHCINVTCGRNAENIEVDSSHTGFAVHPLAMLVIANRLRQPREAWQPLPLQGGKPRLSSLLPSLVGVAP
jgi:pimeloyl-ACP methyl ester carboxylesterase